MHTYHIIGLMSGSSLDGLDIAYCRFTVSDNRWAFEILQAETIPFTLEWIERLKALPMATAKELAEAHAHLGSYFGELVSEFIQKHNLRGKVDAVASHGHTIFHFPAHSCTTQIADGAAIATKVGVPVVCDFRTTDIALGGQGTPIVPIGDKLLFPDYKLCLNIGGIYNISAKTDRDMIAFDVCAANQVLNHLAAQLGFEYDEDGKAAAQGKLNNELLQQLNALDFYKLPYPKSLDNSFSKLQVLPLLDGFDIPVHDKLHTYCEHIAVQIAAHIRNISERENLSVSPADKLLVTGGGALNLFLAERISAHAGVQVVVPAMQIVQFKEALVIALMGVLRLRNEVNVLASVTGAAKDSVSGAVYSLC
jgi:anhydro-N-acetylmuramic acid kinase